MWRTAVCEALSYPKISSIPSSVTPFVSTSSGSDSQSLTLSNMEQRRFFRRAGQDVPGMKNIAHSMPNTVQVPKKKYVPALMLLSMYGVLLATTNCHNHWFAADSETLSVRTWLGKISPMYTHEVPFHEAEKKMAKM